MAVGGGQVSAIDLAERHWILDAALAPGASVAGVARANDVNANQAFKCIRRSRERWRDRRCGAGKRRSASARSSPEASESLTFVAVRLAAPEPTAAVSAPTEKESAPSLRHDAPSVARSGAIEVRLPNGARVRGEAGVDREVLRLVHSTLSGL
jgi:transposase-like protein